MRLLIFPSFSQPPLLRRGRPLVSQYRLRQWYPISFHSKRPPGYSLYRLGGFSSKCSVVDVDVDASSIAMEDETSEDLTSCSNTLTPLASDIFYSDSFKLLEKDDCINSLLREVPVLTKDEQAALAATPAHPAVVGSGLLRKRRVGRSRICEVEVAGVGFGQGISNGSG
ncbi:hypothetical protein IEQ34_007762 [Dendrobium chrysotoxum]|uniref:Uncharacterized protein n=1 Tax=Dendrobium chrysotoxum TaxID=161865 RepID=A0AAV7H4Q3_DENCH|nr:hypothetical protein IEQ34_007762 [Dendrobium chrysotoxum]